MYVCCEVMYQTALNKSYESQHLCSLKPSFAHENCLDICRHWFRFTLEANFGSLFWLPGVPISQKDGSLLGPYLEAWGSLLVLETVQNVEFEDAKLASIEDKTAGPL